MVASVDPMKVAADLARHINKKVEIEDFDQKVLSGKLVFIGQAFVEVLPDGKDTVEAVRLDLIQGYVEVSEA